MPDKTQFEPAVTSSIDPWTIPLDKMDVSDGTLFERDSWRPYFERLRREDPVHYLEESPFGPFWSITRYEDIKFVDSRHDLFSSSPTITLGDPDGEMPIEMFMTMDPPRHAKQRKAVQPVATPSNLARLEGLIRQRVIDILENLPVGEVFDWVPRVGIELTTQMLATLFGFPLEERSKLSYWSDMTTASPELAAEADMMKRKMALQDCLQTFMGMWQDRLARTAAGEAPGFDLISMMQGSEDTIDMPTRPMEFLGNILLLIVGGNDTTRNTISASVLGLNQFPSEYDKLRANPDLIPNMVSEIIRWHTPIAMMRRTAREDVELGGKTIRAGDKIAMWYVSGNRDEEQFERADDLIIDRENARSHLSFGFGVHHCMGNRLAEMQLRILWEEILKRFSNIEVVGEPERINNNMIRGFESMKVKLTRV